MTNSMRSILICLAVALSPLIAHAQPSESLAGCVNLAHGGRAAPGAIVRACQAAARDAMLPVPDRVAALVYQGRSELALRLPAAAMVSAQLALRLLREQGVTGTVAVRLLLADALRESGECKRARPEYLHVLETDPEHVLALAGLRDCQAAPAAPRRGRKMASAATERGLP